MDVLAIPFVSKVGIERSSARKLHLPWSDSNQNHLQTVHASAQFALAETASGEYLQTVFPELAGKVLPVLRDAQIKFKKPASGTITTECQIDDENRDKFKYQLAKKGRSVITVNVKLLDEDRQAVCQAEYRWFIQTMVVE